MITYHETTYELPERPFAELRHDEQAYLVEKLRTGFEKELARNFGINELTDLGSHNKIFIEGYVNKPALLSPEELDNVP